MKIEDYALIGDLRTSALVGRNGSIDWLCLPRTDSPACFAALLGNEENGRWLLCSSAPVRRVTRRYREGTLILETDFETDTGTARVIDFMPLRDGGAPRRVHLALLDHRDRRRTTRKRGSVPGLLVLARHGTRDERRADEARELFERLLSLGNDVGLFSEEYDVAHRRLVGNFPPRRSPTSRSSRPRKRSQTPPPMCPLAMSIRNPLDPETTSF